MGSIFKFFSLVKANPLGMLMQALPYIIWLVAVLTMLYTAYEWAYQNGRSDERLEWVTAENKALQESKEALEVAIRTSDKLNRDMRALEAKYQAEDQAKSANYQKELQNVEKTAKRTIAELRANAIKLRDPYLNRVSGLTESGAGESGTPSSGCVGETGAELSIETSEFLVDLTSEADEVVEQLTYTQDLLIECRARAGALPPVIQ